MVPFFRIGVTGELDEMVRYVVMIHLLFQPYNLFKINISKCFIEKSSFFGAYSTEKKLFSPVLGHPH